MNLLSGTAQDGCPGELSRQVEDLHDGLRQANEAGFAGLDGHRWLLVHGRSRPAGWFGLHGISCLHFPQSLTAFGCCAWLLSSRVGWSNLHLAWAQNSQNNFFRI